LYLNQIDGKAAGKEEVWERNMGGSTAPPLLLQIDSGLCKQERGLEMAFEVVWGNVFNGHINAVAVMEQ
jgi:hypothetical protein